jgi:hypothetical protein
MNESRRMLLSSQAQAAYRKAKALQGIHTHKPKRNERTHG